MKDDNMDKLTDGIQEHFRISMECTKKSLAPPPPAKEVKVVAKPKINEPEPKEEDLMNRLAALSSGSPEEEKPVISFTPEPEVKKTFDPPPPAVPEVASAPAENSLIARIKAQQAKKDSQPLPPPPPHVAPTMTTPIKPQEPPPPFPSTMNAPPPPAAFFAAPPSEAPPAIVASDADFDIIDTPPPPVFEAPVISAPPITPVAAPVAVAPIAVPTLTAALPPPTFEQFLGTMSSEPLQATSYPSLSTLPEPVLNQPLHQLSITSTRAQTPPPDSLDTSDAAIAQQREIMEQIERAKHGLSAPAPAPTSTSTTPTSSHHLTTQHEITPGKNVTLYSQEATKKAVEEGTAHLVKCLSCNGWMQVIKSATLVFCPNCQIISPVSSDNTKELGGGSVSMVSSYPGAPATAPYSITADSSTQSDAALAAMLQAQFDEEDHADASAAATTSSSSATRSIMPDILRRNQPITQAQRDAHIASLTPSQRAMHGFEESEARSLMPVSVGTEMQNMPARETQSAGMLNCLKTGVESAGTAMRGSFSSMNFLGRKSSRGGGYPGGSGGLVLANLGGDNNNEANYALLEEDDL